MKKLLAPLALLSLAGLAFAADAAFKKEKEIPLTVHG